MSKKWSQNGFPGCRAGRRSPSHDSHGHRGALPFLYFAIDLNFHNPHSSLSTSQALETKMVSEENSGNCPVCVDPFQIGDQVRTLRLSHQGLSNSLVFRCCCRAARRPTCTAATPTAFTAGSPGENPSFSVVIVSSFLLQFSHLTVNITQQVIKLFHRQATCPVCRQRLGAEEEEEGDDDGGDVPCAMM